MRWWPCVAVALLSFGARAQTLLVDGTNSPYTVATATTFTSAEVASGGVLILNAKLTVSGDMVVRSGGRVTVDSSVMHLKLAVTGTLTVEPSGSIDADGKGLGPNQTMDATTLTVIMGGSNGTGGSHATRGGAAFSGQLLAPAAYGDALTLTPGGGGSNGVAGGGICEISAGSLVLNGRLRANGLSNGPGGEGAGGSVSVVTGSFSGAGLLHANGGALANGGGAGRLKVTFTTWNFTGSVSAMGARGDWGSVYLVDTQNRLLVLTPTSLPGGEHFAALTLQPGAALSLDGDTTIDAPVTVPNGASLTLNSVHAADHLSLTRIGGALVVKKASVLNAKLSVTGTVSLEAPLALPELDLEAGAVMSHPSELRNFELRVTGALRVLAAARIDANAMGLLPGVRGWQFGLSGATIDPATGIQISGSGPSNGGSHAGRGGRVEMANALAEPYDDPEHPMFPGGGGGGVSHNTNDPGGAGGGVLRVWAGSLQVDGQIRADGEPAPSTPQLNPQGGGAGGTVYINTGALTGTGLISARGGIGTMNGSSGGGGIVHIVASSIASTVTRSVAGGMLGAVGEPGALVEHLGAFRITSTPVTSVKPGQAYVYAATTNATGAVTWALTTAPTGATVSPTGQVQWAATGAGPVVFTLTATSGALSDSQTFAVDVLVGPTITSTPNPNATQGQPYSYDADGKAEASGSGPFTWSALMAPSGLTIDPLTAAVTWTPSSAGASWVCLRVVNASGDAAQCFSVSVTSNAVADDGGVDVPRAPRFLSTPDTSVQCGTAYHYSGDQVPAVDGSGPLTFSIEGLPGKALPDTLTVDAMTGAFHWIPDSTQGGAVPLRLVVTNPLGRDEQTFVVVVDCAPSTEKTVSCGCGAVDSNLLGLFALAWVLRRVTKSTALRSPH